MNNKLLNAINSNELTSIPIVDAISKKFAIEMATDLINNRDDTNFASDLACNVLDEDMKDLVTWSNSNSARRKLYNDCDCYSDDKDRLQQAQLIELETIAIELLEY